MRYGHFKTNLEIWSNIIMKKKRFSAYCEDKTLLTFD